MRDILNIMKSLAVSAFMARLGIGRLIGCGVLVVLILCACIGLLLVQLFNNTSI